MRRTGPRRFKGLEKLGDAADWAGQLDAHVNALERAYAAHSKDRNQRRAAMMAMLLARAYSSRLEGPVASGWRARAERLLADEPECVEQGELALRKGGAALSAGDPDGALMLLGRAIQLAIKFESRDLWALAVHIQGQALILRGEVAPGLSLIDEVTAAAVGGELSPGATGLVYCWTIAVCRDLRRVGSRLEAIGARGRALAATSVRQAFMFTDMIESTSLLEAIGDQAWADVVRWHDQALRALIQEHGGEEVDHAGDGFFVAFPDARNAVDCACAIQRRLAAHRREHGFAPPVRIGVHAAVATRVGGG